jgi:hypothetical protein
MVRDDYKLAVMGANEALGPVPQEVYDSVTRKRGRIREMTDRGLTLDAPVGSIWEAVNTVLRVAGHIEVDGMDATDIYAFERLGKAAVECAAVGELKYTFVAHSKLN